jgi:hypothetical protein
MHREMLVLQRRPTASDAVALVRLGSHIQAVKLAPAHHVSDFPVPRASVPNAHADHGRQRHIRSLGRHLLLPTSLAYLLLAASQMMSCRACATQVTQLYGKMCPGMFGSFTASSLTLVQVGTGVMPSTSPSILEKF